MLKKVDDMGFLSSLFGSSGSYEKNGKPTTLRSGNDRAIVSEKGNRTDVYVTGKGESGHCHAWANADTGESGVEHRGHCDQCGDDVELKDVKF